MNSPAHCAHCAWMRGIFDSMSTWFERQKTANERNIFGFVFCFAAWKGTRHESIAQHNIFLLFVCSYCYGYAWIGYVFSHRIPSYSEQVFGIRVFFGIFQHQPSPFIYIAHKVQTIKWKTKNDRLYAYAVHVQRNSNNNNINNIVWDVDHLNDDLYQIKLKHQIFALHFPSILFFLSVFSLFCFVWFSFI